MNFLNRIKIFCQNNKWLILIIVFFILLRIPSLFESYWYGDEAIYAALAKGMHDGKTLYSQVWDHKPPLLYYIYYIAGFFDWSIGLILVRALSIISGIISMVFLSKILKTLFNKNLAVNLSLIFFAFFLGSTLFEGNTANAEVFFITFNILLLYLLIKNKNVILIGFIAFLSFAIKTPAFIESAFMIFAFLLIILKENGFKEVLSKFWKIAIGFLVPFITLIIVLYINKSLGDFIQTAFLQNLSYSAEMDKDMIFFGRSLSANLIKFGSLAIISIISIYSYYKKEINKYSLVIILLISVEIFSSFISGRNYPHYLLQALPGLTILLGFSISRLKRNAFFYNFKYLLVFALFLQLLLTTFTRGKSLDVYAPPPDYYPYFFTNVITNKPDPKKFWWKDGESVIRVKSFSSYLNANYSGNKNFYLYSSESWILALTKIKFTNKFVTWYHLGFNPDYMKQDIENRNNSELFIVDETTPKKGEFFKDISQFKKIDEYDNFSIYKNVGYQKSYTALK